MAFLLDVIGSFALVGALILTVATVNVNLNEDMYESTLELNTQRNLIEVARLIEYDLLKIGYNTPKPAILFADSNRIMFKADLANKGTVDSVRYFLGSPMDPGVAGTPNPGDRVLYRLVNDEPQRGASLGVVEFRLTYYDSLGVSTSVLGLIRSIRVELTVESPYPVDSTYPGAYWEKLIFPRNL